MKKLFLLLAITTLAFASCSKSDDGDSPISLRGTTWSEVEASVTTAVKFTSATECAFSFSAGTTVITNEYSYEYSHPTVRMYPKESGYAELKGLINGNTMNVINTSNGKTIYVLQKK